MKHLTEEQFDLLRKAAYEFVTSVTWGNDVEVEKGNAFDEYLEDELIKPFIEPLINGTL